MENAFLGQKERQLSLKAQMERIELRRWCALIGLLGNAVACVEPHPDFVEEWSRRSSEPEATWEEDPSKESESGDDSETDRAPIYEINVAFPKRSDESEESRPTDDQTPFSFAMGSGLPAIVINEVNVQDGWIEFYNNSPRAWPLGGVSFANRSFITGEDTDHVFNFPLELEIEPWGYLVVIVDGSSSGLINLDRENDSLVLYSGRDGAGAILDLTSWSDIQEDLSWGRSLDGEGEFIEIVVSPGAENIAAE